MTELRIILSILGAIILALIYYFGKKEKKPKDNFDSTPIEPNLNLSKSLPNDLPRKASGISIDDLDVDQNQGAKQDNKDKIITLFIHAKNGLQFDWHLIQSATEQVGLELAKDNLYHRYNGIGENKQLIFMVANMLKPGTFQPDMRTTGLVLIMTLPGVMGALDMWDTMFPVGERIAKILDSNLTDENHHIFSRQRIAAMREEMREFDRLHIV